MERPIDKINNDLTYYDKLYFHKQTITKTNRDNEITREIKHHYKVRTIIYNGDDDKDDKDKKSTFIHLTEAEVLLFEELMHVIKDSGCGTTLRVAGGWIRDKLRGDDSHDIDITLDNMMGEQFAELVNKHLSNKHHQTHRIGVIQSNPEQSKHLETATVKIFDMWIDFVNLRSETYTESSRIPEISIGTPLDDSLRRDLTINSLFFNINENRIEDLTNKGIEDLKNGIIRTPLPSLTTFLDDPLRVFRSIRFANRLGFEIDEELKEAAKNPIVKDAIKSKISHERIAKEFDGMISSNTPEGAIRFINEFNLFDCIFSLPTSGMDEESKEVIYMREYSSTGGISEMYIILLFLYGFHRWGKEFEESINTTRQRILSALMIPFHGINFKNSAKKNKEMSIIHYMFIEYIKFSNKDYDDVSLILDCSKQFIKHIRLFGKDKLSFNRKEVGLIIHQCANLWIVSIVMATLQIYHQDNQDEGVESDLSAILLTVNQFVNTIKINDLIGIWNLKRMLNGKQVQDLFNKKPGTWLAPIIQKILEWQLENPTKNEQDCKDWLLTLKID